MKILLLMGLLFTQAWAVEPLEPRSVPNTPRQTLTVSLHPDLTTMLVFPQPVSMIVGAGLTDGGSAGLVQFDHRKDSPVVTFQPLQAAQGVFAQIIAGETVYFLRLKPEARPDSVVTIAVPANGNSSREVSVEEVFSQRLVIPPERLRQLVELARSAAVLSTAMPDEYPGSEALEVSMTKRVGELETQIVKIHRFPKEDALVFFGTITNRGKTHTSVGSGNLCIQVGTRTLVPNWCAPFNRVLHAGESIRFECVVTGDGQGNRLHLSIRNTFTCSLSTTSPLSPP